MNKMLEDDLSGYNTFQNTYKTKDGFQKFYQKLEQVGVSGICNLTSEEQKLETYMKQERSGYVEKSMQKEGEKTPFPPAEPFYSQKNSIKESNLYKKVFSRMPKGGLLHVHSCAGLSVDGLIALIVEWNAREENKKETGNHIYILSNEKAPLEKYIPGMLLYEDQLGVLKEHSTPFTDYIHTTEGMDKVRQFFTFGGDYVEKIPYAWDYFNLIFLRTSALFSHKEFYKEYHIRFFRECLEDKIPYVEVRSGFETFQKDLIHEMVSHPEFQAERAIYFHEMLSDADPDNPDDEFLKIMHKAMEEVAGIKVKVILNARRSPKPQGQDLANLCKKVDAAIRLLERYNNPEEPGEYKDFLIGFDFVSEEDRGQPTDAYAKAIIYKQVGEGYEGSPEPAGLPRIKRINFFLHDGESDWPENDNMVSATAISRHRIGHGIALIKNPGLLDQITSQQGGLGEPVLEVCPISNQILRYHKDLRNHSLLELLKRGVLCVIANDDPQLFGNSGLSYDFWEAFVALNLPLAVIKGMILIAYYYGHYDYTVDLNPNVKPEERKTEQQIMAAAYADFKMNWETFVTAATKEISP